jgi:hypothetical protein
MDFFLRDNHLVRLCLTLCDTVSPRRQVGPHDVIRGPWPGREERFISRMRSVARKGRQAAARREGKKKESPNHHASFGWWPVAEADLLREKNTGGWWLCWLPAEQGQGIGFPPASHRRRPSPLPARFVHCPAPLPLPLPLPLPALAFLPRALCLHRRCPRRPRR